MGILAAATGVMFVGSVLALRFGTTLPHWPFFGLAMAVYAYIALDAAWLSERPFPHDVDVATPTSVEAQKREAVGQLASGMAHEVKNPLMVLLTGVRYLQQRVPAGDPAVKTLLEDMHEAVTRADVVITGLLDYSAPAELRLAPSDVNAAIKRAASSVERELSEAAVALELELSAGLPPIALDTIRFHQVLVHVLRNAVHATPPDGRITARTYATADRNHLDGPDAVIMLEVDDTGSGIPHDSLGRIFDPFFTTKPPGAGTGLGLAVSRRIVEMHGASINIANRPEGGTRVSIAFRVPKERTQ